MAKAKIQISGLPKTLRRRKALSAATANGFTGLFGYASTIVSGAGLGYLAQHYGWNHAYIAMIAMALVGMAVFLLMWGAGRDGYETDAE